MFDCIVIGAGPGGLVTTKELLEQNVTDVVCLEKTDNLGGVFNRAYDSLKLTSSCTYSMFSDFWMGDGKQHEFWSKTEVVDYWRRYARNFGVLEKIRFNAEVKQASLTENGVWEVLLQSGESLLSKRIALATGNNNIPNYPQWKESLTDIDYSHSQHYSNADRFTGKNVLVVGGGESGSDVAFEVSRVAKNCWISLRSSAGWILPRKRGDVAADIATHRGLYGLPRDFGHTLSQLIIEKELSQKDPIHNTVVQLNAMVQSKNGVWGTYGTKNFGLPHAIVKHGCQVVGDVTGVTEQGRTLMMAKGETLQNVDAVVFCTGYKNHVPFLPQELQAIEPRRLYKHMFDPELRDKIVWIGWARPTYGSQFPIMEMQARYFALICSNRQELPGAQEMKRVIVSDRDVFLKQFEHSAARIRSLVDYHIYMDAMADIIGCQPPLWQYFFLKPKLWLRLMYGATQATQFRLRGPGQKQALADDIIMRLPVSSFNHVVKAGLRGRLRYAFEPFSNLFKSSINSVRLLKKQTLG